MNKLLKPEDKQAIVTYYQGLLAQHGDSEQSLDWNSRKNQVVRFLALSLVGDLSGKSILDVGCGLGDFYAVIRKNYSSVKYTGIDVVPSFIHAAQKKYPTANFISMQAGEVTQTFDYIFASGTWSNVVPKYQMLYLEIIKHLYEQTTIAVAFNMLDERFHVRDKVYATYHPEIVREECKKFAHTVVLVSGYLQYDFTVFLYKKN